MAVLSERRDPEKLEMAIATAVLLVATAYSPGGVVFALANSLWSAGPEAFDAARRLTFKFSKERYPLMDRMRHLHATTKESRAIEAREYAWAQVRANVEDPLRVIGLFWMYGIVYAWTMSRMQAYFPDQRS